MVKSSNADKPVLSKRQQTIANREAELLNIAEKLVCEYGFANFTMDKLTANTNYSKGTIYNHFISKEDLITALCIKSLTAEIELFKQAMTFPGNSREKCLAVLYAYQKHAFEHPILFMCVLSAKTQAVMEKSSEQRLELEEKLSKEVTHYCDTLFGNAIEGGSLKLNCGMSAESYIFATWAMAFGTNALMVSASSVETISRLSDRIAQLDNINILLDGMGWQPLSNQFDYQDTWQRVQAMLASPLETNDSTATDKVSE